MHSIYIDKRKKSYAGYHNYLQPINIIYVNNLLTSLVSDGTRWRVAWALELVTLVTVVSLMIRT